MLVAEDILITVDGSVGDNMEHALLLAYVRPEAVIREKLNTEDYNRDIAIFSTNYTLDSINVECPDHGYPGLANLVLQALNFPCFSNLADDWLEAQARKEKNQGIVTGICIYCGEITGFGLEVCDSCSNKICTNDEPIIDNKQEKIVIREYKGKHSQVVQEFKLDAEHMKKLGYSPVSQSWAPGSYGFGAFFIAFLLCFIIIGIFAFLYLIIVKPDGALTVTYEHREQTSDLSSRTVSDHESNKKTCPMCAESVKVPAKICRYCNHVFE